MNFIKTNIQKNLKIMYVFCFIVFCLVIIPIIMFYVMGYLRGKSNSELQTVSKITEIGPDTVLLSTIAHTPHHKTGITNK